MTDDPPNSCQPSAALQIIDANLNRASEGLRVVEEYCRFVQADASLTARCKSLRDQLHAAIEPISRGERLTARDTTHDVGATTAFHETLGREASAGSLEQIAIKNGERVKEALRVIEEYGKTVNSDVSRAVQSLRYQWYMLERDCHLHRDRATALLAARLYVLLDGGASECAFAERAGSLIEAGVHILQLRDKTLDDRTLLVRARLLRRIIDDFDRGQRSEIGGQNVHSSPLTADQPPLLIINDRPDIAALARADGVHVGQDDLQIRDARRIAGGQMLIGVSTHNIEQARQAVIDGADYIGCGPTFPSGTKHFDHFPGLDFLRQVAAEISLPAFAIGGITLDNLPQVVHAGFQRVASGGAMNTAGDVAHEVRVFLEALDHG